ncbi:hypothetical protein HK101_007225, partial [Irineochytrium annulatum]
VFFPNDAPVDWAAAIATATSTSHAARQARIEADDLLLDRSNATTLPRESYVGVYTNPGYGRLSVSLPDSPAKVGEREIDLVATLADSTYPIVMRFSHWGGDRFGMMGDTLFSFRPDGGAYFFGDFAVENGTAVELNVEPWGAESGLTTTFARAA